MMKDLVKTAIGTHDRTCLGNPAEEGPESHNDYCDVIHYELEQDKGSHLPSHNSDAEFMKRVRKDGNSMFYGVVTEGLPEYAKL